MENIYRMYFEADFPCLTSMMISCFWSLTLESVSAWEEIQNSLLFFSSFLAIVVFFGNEWRIQGKDVQSQIWSLLLQVPLPVPLRCITRTVDSLVCIFAVFFLFISTWAICKPRAYFLYTCKLRLLLGGVWGDVLFVCVCFYRVKLHHICTLHWFFKNSFRFTLTSEGKVQRFQNSPGLTHAQCLHCQYTRILHSVALDKCVRMHMHHYSIVRII